MIPLETLSYNFTKFFSFFNRAPPRDFFWIYLQDVMILSVETSFIKKTRDLHYIYPGKSKFWKSNAEIKQWGWQAVKNHCNLILKEP